MSVRKIAVVGVLGLASIGLIGAGTGATFTDAVHTTQKITAGTINVQLTSSANGVTVSQNGKTATFADLGPTQSTFTSGAVPTVITNNGTATANAITLSAADVLGADSHSAALAAQLCVKIISPINGQVAYDGKVSALVSSPLQLQGPIAPGGTDSFTTEFYAGGAHAAAGCTDLNDDAQGGQVTPQITVTYQG